MRRISSLRLVSAVDVPLSILRPLRRDDVDMCDRAVPRRMSASPRSPAHEEARDERPVPKRLDEAAEDREERRESRLMEPSVILPFVSSSFSSCVSFA